MRHISISFHFLCIQVKIQDKSHFMSSLLHHFIVRFLASKEKKRRAAEGQNKAGDGAGESKEERVITLRALNMEDFKLAKNQVNTTHLLVFTTFIYIKSLLKSTRNLFSLLPHFSSTFYVTPTSPCTPLMSTAPMPPFFNKLNISHLFVRAS